MKKIDSKKMNRFFLFLMPFLLTACAAAGTVSAVSQLASAALEATGLKKPDVPDLPDAQKPPRSVALKLHANPQLNTDHDGKPLSVVVKLYKLRQESVFQQAGYDTFLNPQKEKEFLGSDLIEVKEVVLMPGQRYEINDKVTREAYFIGVVALFRNPAPGRWRVSFNAEDAGKSGILLGVHSCSLTVGEGAKATGSSAFQSQLLSPVRCS